MKDPETTQHCTKFRSQKLKSGKWEIGTPTFRFRPGRCS